MQKTDQPTKRTRTATQAWHLRPDSPRPDSPRHPPRGPRGIADGTTASHVPAKGRCNLALAEEEPPHKRARKEEEGEPPHKRARKEEEGGSSSSGGHSASPTTHETSVKRVLNEFDSFASSVIVPILTLIGTTLAEQEKEMKASKKRLKAIEDNIRSTQTSINSAGVRIAGTI